MDVTPLSVTQVKFEGIGEMVLMPLERIMRNFGAPGILGKTKVSKNV